MATPEKRAQAEVLAYWDPFRDLPPLRSRLDDLFGQWLGPWQAAAQGFASGFTPLADVEETDDAWIIEVELPGVKKSDVDVELHGRTVVVKGERKERERAGVLRRKTRVTGTFRYELTLPGAFEETIDAKLADGELTVRIPKAIPEQPRKVPISS